MASDVDNLLHGVASSTRDALAAGCVLTIGNFDGIHTGHAAIVAEVVERAHQAGLPSAALTFEPHPVVFFRSLAPERFRVTTSDARARRLRELGVDHVITLPFDTQLAQLDAERFVDGVVLDGLRARRVHVGHDFHFGKGRRGTPEMLRARCAAAGVPVRVQEAILLDGAPISSTRIRGALREGDMAAVQRLLGAPYEMTGVVQAGAGRGAEIGVPTLNIYPEDTLLPPKGVYATRALVDGRWQDAISNLGTRPSFDDGERVSFETMLLEPVTGRRDGETLRVALLAWIREERRFATPSALKEQIALDLEQARRAHRHQS